MVKTHTVERFPNPPNLFHKIKIKCSCKLWDSTLADRGRSPCAIPSWATSSAWAGSPPARWAPSCWQEPPWGPPRSPSCPGGRNREKEKIGDLEITKRLNNLEVQSQRDGDKKGENVDGSCRNTGGVMLTEARLPGCCHAWRSYCCRCAWATATSSRHNPAALPVAWSRFCGNSRDKEIRAESPAVSLWPLKATKRFKRSEGRGGAEAASGTRRGGIT